MSRLDELKALLKNDAAKAKVQKLNKMGEAAIKGAVDGDEKLSAYRAYVDKFYELKEKYPNWEERLNKPLEYSRFVLDYDEKVFSLLSRTSADFKGKTPIEVFTMKMHGINYRAISILQEKMAEIGPEWRDEMYFNTHIKEAFQILRSYYPNDEEYDQVFSPKEMLIFDD